MDTDACCGPPGTPRERQTNTAERTGASPAQSARDMISLDGGRFLMGSEDKDSRQEDGEGPVREVFVSPFLIDRTAVTCAEFSAFVEDTGFVTEAETFGWSYVFKGLLPKSKQRKLQRTHDVKAVPWWFAVEDANWRKPEGPGSNIRKRMAHPVTQVSWHDAEAYCQWAGTRLPTEAEWEFAARGGLAAKRYPWGDKLMDGRKHQCNIWQGQFPDTNTLDDGYLGTAPAKSFRPNGYGLYNVSGNVWEWCSDWYSRDWHREASHPLHDPTGPKTGDRKILKGGSYLCHDSYCNRYRLAARYANTPDSATGHAGFRCVRGSPGRGASRQDKTEKLSTQQSAS